MSKKSQWGGWNRRWVSLYERFQAPTHVKIIPHHSPHYIFWCQPFAGFLCSPLLPIDISRFYRTFYIRANEKNAISRNKNIEVCSSIDFQSQIYYCLNDSNKIFYNILFTKEYIKIKSFLWEPITVKFVWYSDITYAFQGFIKRVLTFNSKDGLEQAPREHMWCLPHLKELIMVLSFLKFQNIDKIDYFLQQGLFFGYFLMHPRKFSKFYSTGECGCCTRYSIHTTTSDWELLPFSNYSLDQHTRSES